MCLQFKVLTKLFWTTGCLLTRRAIIDLVTTKPEFCTEGIQGKAIIELVAAMSDEVNPEDEVHYYRSIFSAAMDAEGNHPSSVASCFLALQIGHLMMH